MTRPIQGRFLGRGAIVTGGAKGIGAATATRLADEGASVVLIDTDSARLGETHARIARTGAPAAYVCASVAEAATWTAAASALHALGVGVDIVHSNAYHHRPGDPRTVEPAQWDQVMSVNVGGLYLGARILGDELIERGGSLIATSSVHAMFGLPDYSAYAASKGALTALCRQLAVQYAPRVRVNCVLPGPVATHALADHDEDGRAARATALGRVGSAEEIASVVAFLASEDASFITGASIVVDGGWSITKNSS